MEEFPGNSQRARAAPEKAEDKKVERITRSEVIRRKKPLNKRFLETFFGGDAKGVWSYVALDVILPATKDMIADAGSMGLERMLFGEARSYGRRSGRRPPSDSHIAYNRYSRSSRDDPRDRERERPAMSRRGRANFDFQEIIIPTRVEAEEVIDKMFELVSKYESVTVADLYDMLGIEWNYTDQKYGWDDLRGAGVQRVSNGYLLDLTRPEPLR